MSRRSSRRAARREGADADKPDRDPPCHTPQDRRGGLALWQAIREISPKGRKEYEPTGRHREYVNLNCTLCTRLGIWWGLYDLSDRGRTPGAAGAHAAQFAAAPSLAAGASLARLLIEAEARS